MEATHCFHRPGGFREAQIKERIMTITIKTRLHDGIYKSCGGGEVRTHYEFSTGPRNLLKAIDTLAAHQTEMVASYGNIGCGGSWMEIDGIEIHAFDLQEIRRDDSEFFNGIDCSHISLIKSRTQKARELLAEVTAGTYSASKYNA